MSLNLQSRYQMFILSIIFLLSLASLSSVLLTSLPSKPALHRYNLSLFLNDYFCFHFVNKNKHSLIYRLRTFLYDTHRSACRKHTKEVTKDLFVKTKTQEQLNIYSKLK